MLRLHRPRLLLLVVWALYAIQVPQSCQAQQYLLDDKKDIGISFGVTWNTVAQSVAPAPRADHTLVQLGSQLVLFGGRNASRDAHLVESDELMASYNLVSKTWNSLPADGGPTRRFGHTAGSQFNEAGVQGMVLFGGRGVTEQGSNWTALGDLWVYDVEQNSWQSFETNASTPSARYHHTMTWVPFDKTHGFYIVSGGMGSDGSVLSDIWKLQLTCTTQPLKCTPSWKMLQSQHTRRDDENLTQRYGHAAAYYPLGSGSAHSILLFGGIDSSSSILSGVTLVNLINDSGEFDQYSPNTVPGDYADNVKSRCFHTVLSYGPKLYIFGGQMTMNADSAVQDLIIMTKSGGSLQIDQFLSPMNASDIGNRTNHAAVFVEPSYFVSPGQYRNAPCYDDVSDSDLGKLQRNCALMMLFGGEENTTEVHNDLWAYRNFSRKSKERIFVAFRNGRSGGNMFLEHSDGNSSRVHMVGGVVNDYGSDPGAHIVTGQRDVIMDMFWDNNNDLHMQSSSSNSQVELELNELALDEPENAYAPLAVAESRRTQQSIRLEPGSPAESLRDFSIDYLNKTTVIVHGGRVSPDLLGMNVTMDQNISGKTYLYTLPINSSDSGTWRYLKTLSSQVNTARYSHCSAVYQGDLIVYGGVSKYDPDSKATGQVLRLSMNNLTWSGYTSPNASLNQVTFGHSCNMFGHLLVIVGGFTFDPQTSPLSPNVQSWTLASQNLAFDLHAQTFIGLSFSGDPSSEDLSFAFHRMMRGPNSTLIVLGGLIKPASRPQDPYEASNQVLVADLEQCLKNPSVVKCNGWYQPASSISSGLAPYLYRHSLHLSPEMTSEANSITHERALLYGGLSSAQDGTVNDKFYSVNFSFTPITPNIPPTPTPAPSPDGSGPSTSNVVILVATISVVCAIIASGTFTVIYYRKNAQKIQEFQESLAAMSPQDVDSNTEADQQEWGKSRENPEDYRNWEREFGKRLVEAPDFVEKFESLRLVKQIGHVHVGWWNDSPVAVKRFFLHRNYQPEDFYRETLVHRQLKHKNVLELLAITINPPCSVTPLMRYGSLFHILQSGQELHYSHILQIALDTAEGMRYLHSMSVIHRDLKTLNLLVDDTWCVKVCDFGIARFQVSAMTAAIGSIQYMAPEVFIANHYTTKSDIYSYAIVLWEMLTRKVPYAGNSSPFVVCCSVREGKRLEIPDNCRSDYRQLIEKCWAQEANDRADFEEVCELVTVMMEHAEKENVLMTPRESLRESMKDVVLPGNVSTSAEGDELLGLSTTSRQDFADFLNESQPAVTENESTSLLHNQTVDRDSTQTDATTDSTHVSIHTETL